MGAKNIILGFLCLLVSTLVVAQCPNNPSVFQPNGNVSQYSENNHLMLVLMEVTAGDCMNDVVKFEMNYTGNSLNDVDKIKIWYSGSSAVFDPGVNDLFGEVNVASPGIAINGSIPLEVGFNHFWISVDVPATAVSPNSIDVQLENVEINNGSVSQIFNNGIHFNGNPPEELKVANTVFTVHTVGASQAFPSIQAAYNAIPFSLSSNYLIEVWPDYNASAEAFPIVFDVRNTIDFGIYIWPQKDATPVVEGDPGSNIPMVRFVEASNVVIDGRPEGKGNTKAMTWRNSRDNNSVGAVFSFDEASRFNDLKYLDIQANTNNNVSGIIDFLNSSNAVTTGSTDNTIEYNLIRKNQVSTNSTPGVGIYSSGAPARPNINNKVAYNEFVGIWDGPSGANSYSLQLATGSSGWVIEGNHFYQETAGSYAGNNVGSGFISVSDGEDLVIKNNYFGGTERFVGGSAFTITSGDSPFDFIYFSSGSAGANNLISGNTFGNFRYTTTAAIGGFPAISLIYNEGASDFEIEDNLFGSMASNNSIVVTNTNVGSPSTSYGVMGVVNNQPGNNQVVVRDNSFGGVIIEGTNPNMVSCMVFNQNEGLLVVEDNVFGGTVPGSIEMKASSALSIIRDLSTSKVELNGNDFKNISHQGASGSLYMISKSFGDLDVLDNQFFNINSNSSSGMDIVYHKDGTYKINGNEFGNITHLNTGSGALNMIYLSTSVDGQVKDNMIGNAMTPNISSAKDGDLCGIYKTGSGGVLDCSGNTIQGLRLSTAGTIVANLWGINMDNGVLKASSNHIQGLYSNADPSSNILDGIHVSSSSANHEIINNEINNLVIESGAGTGERMSAINLASGSGDIKENYIHTLLNEKSNSTSFVRAIELSSGPWDIHNNVIWLKNTNNVGGYQLRVVSFNSTSAVNFFHNTIKIESTVPYYFVTGLDVNQNGNFDISNNVFQNLASGTNNSFEAKTICSTSPRAIPVFRNNYHECPSNPLEVVRWGGLTEIYDVVTWGLQTSVSSPFTGVETVSNEGYASGLFFSNLGVDLTTEVPNDKDGIVRSTTPWLGAYEGNAVCDELLVTSSLDLGVCGDLRFAINYANTNPGPDTIYFDTLSMLGHSIKLTAALPALSGVNGDGTVIWGDLSNDGDPDIEIEGGLAGLGVNGLTINSTGNTISGLVINGFSNHAILLEGASSNGNIIISNYLGLGYFGNGAVNNSGNGIQIINGASDNIIGRVSEGNVISGNTYGVFIGSAAGGDNIIASNLIGSDNTGNALVGNSNSGINIQSDNNVVGLPLPGGGNVIIGSATQEFFTNKTGIVFQNNRLGLGLDSVTVFPSPADRVLLFSIGNTLGGFGPYEANVFAGAIGGATVQPVDIEFNPSNLIHGNVFIQNNGQGIKTVATAMSPIIVATYPDSTIEGTANPGSLVQLYAEDNGEGRYFIGVTTADGGGDWNMTVDDYSFWNGVLGLSNVTAVQDVSGGTSGFSTPFTVDFSLPVDTIIMETFNVDTLCTYVTDADVEFSAYGTFNAGNHFIVQLSDGTGSFVSPMNMDTLTTSTPTVPAQINVDMRKVTAFGAGYRVRVISTSNAYISNDNGDGMVINAIESLVWTGAISSDWFDCSNWDRARVPGSNSSVLIPLTVNQPVISNGIARCLDLTIDVDNGANINIDVDTAGSLLVLKP